MKLAVAQLGAWNAVAVAIAIQPLLAASGQIKPCFIATAHLAASGLGSARPAGRVGSRFRCGRRGGSRLCRNGCCQRRSGSCFAKQRGIVLDKAVALALDGFDAPVAFNLLGIGLVLATPGRIKLLVLPRQIESVSIRHVEHRAGNVALNGFRRFHATNAAVHLHIAGSEHAILARNHPPVEITALAVNFAHRRDEIKQVVVRGVEHRIDLLTALPTGQRRAVGLETG